VAKNAFLPIKPARRGAELLSAIGAQLDAVPPAIAQPRQAPTLPEEVRSPPPVAAPKAAPFVLRLSPDVFKQIDAKAVDEGVTMTVVIAQALKLAGFTVPDDDLKDRRKRRYRE
jgi:hypothetical protein